MGNETNGHIVIDFITPQGAPNYRTLCSPLSVMGLATQFSLAAKSIPNPGTTRLTFDLPGHSSADSTKVYFGQAYGTEILQALGLLVVRANLLEQSLVRLFSAVINRPESQAAAIFYSTVSMKSRLDMLRAAILNSNIEPQRAKNMEKALDRVNRVTGRRNDLIHAHWSFDGNRMSAETYKPISKSPVTKLKVDVKFIESLAADYLAAGLVIDGWAADEINASHIGQKTSTTLSD